MLPPPKGWRGAKNIQNTGHRLNFTECVHRLLLSDRSRQHSRSSPSELCPVMRENNPGIFQLNCQVKVVLSSATAVPERFQIVTD